MASNRTYREVTATAVKCGLPGKPPYTVENTGSQDIYYLLDADDASDAAFAGNAAALQALADGVVAAGRSVSFGANAAKITLVCAATLTSTALLKSGVAV